MENDKIVFSVRKWMNEIIIVKTLREWINWEND